MPPPIEIIDRRALKARLARANRTRLSDDEEHPLLTRVTDDISDRLLTVLRPFERAAVLSLVPTQLPRQMENHPRIETVLEYRILGTDDDPGKVDAIDDEALAFEPESLDMMISLLALQATNDLPGALMQARRALKPDGLFLGVLFGGQTLTELRTSLLESESDITGGASPRVLPFADVRELGALMQRAGFALPVADLDTVQITYETPLHLLRELQTYGASNVQAGRQKSLSRRDVLLRAMEIYAERHTRDDSRITATVDLITLTGWAPSPDQQQPLKPGSATTSLATALNATDVSIKTKSEEDI